MDARSSFRSEHRRISVMILFADHTDDSGVVGAGISEASDVER